MKNSAFFRRVFGLVGTAAILSGTLACRQPEKAAPREEPRTATTAAAPSAGGNLVSLSSRKMIAEFDKRTGAVYSLTEKNGKLKTNYVGNPENVPGENALDSFWTGNVVSTVWELKAPEVPLVEIPSFSFKPSGTWRQESSGHSGDTRKVSFDGKSFRVDYVGPSAEKNGIKSYNLRMAYRFAEDDSLLWDIEIENTTGKVLEIGEIGIPLMFNDYYYGVREKFIYMNTVDDHSILYEDERRKIGELVKIHEERVVDHSYISGHGSYALVERMRGDPPFLLIHPVDDTPLECSYPFEDSLYRFEDTQLRFEGGPRRARPTVLAIQSWAVKNRRRWVAPWVNGHTSLILKPGQKKNYRFRFAFVDGYGAVRDEISKAGNLGIRVFPSMVVQEDEPAYVEIRSKFDPVVSFRSDHCRIVARKRLPDRTLLTFSFKGRGQKNVRLTYDGGKWTNLEFYCTESTADLIDARARFIVDRQFYENPDDPYNRNHMFLPFDYGTGSVFSESDEVWEVGGDNEYGFSEPLFLAEKNVYRPDRKEIETLETYVTDFLIGQLQDQKTYALRGSMYWKERYPSSPRGHWTEKRSKEFYRTYNYPHAVNVYHSMYRIEKLYGLTSRRKPLDYLRLAYRTGIKWFETGPWVHIGLMDGSNVLNVLDDLKAEGLEPEYKALLTKLRECNDAYVKTPYPYTSEFLAGSTGDEQVAFFNRYFGSEEKYRLTLQVIQASRGGYPPTWFSPGGWYMASLNGMPMLKGFEDTGDREMFVQGYAGIMSVTANLFPSGMGFSRHASAPGAVESTKTLDGGIGLYGFLKGAKAYVMTDESFGLVGAGCRVESAEGGDVRATPIDGLKKRLLFADEKIDLEATKGEIRSVLLNKSDKSVQIEATDPTGLVDKAEIVIRGLEKGEYRISHGASSETKSVSGDLKLIVPISEAGKIEIDKIR